jgi:hypothetical protein
MTKSKSILTGLVFIILTSFTSDNDIPKDFSNLLSRAKLTFMKPDGMIETKCIKNIQINYDYALKITNENAEVRYAIQPMDSLLAQYDNAKKKGNDMSNPNQLSKTIFVTVLLNIGMGSSGTPEINRLDSLTLKNEYNADFGVTAIVNLGKDFGGESYKYCTVLMIHKDFIGDACIFYVSDKKIKINETIKNLFHSLKFK